MGLSASEPSCAPGAEIMLFKDDLCVGKETPDVASMALVLQYGDMIKKKAKREP